MKLKEKLEALSKTDAIEEFFILNQFGSFLVFMGDAVREINDIEITEKYNELMNAIQSKRETLSEMEI